MFVTFLVWLNSPRNSETRRKLIYIDRTLFTSSVFLLLTLDEFFDAFQGKKFCLETVCLFQRLVIGQLIRKSCFLDRLFSCWLQSCELLHLRRVLNFFLCFWSELATDEVVLRGTIRLDSTIRSEYVHFHDSFWREQTLAATSILP